VDTDAEFADAAGERLARLGFSPFEEYHRGHFRGMRRYDNGVVIIFLIQEMTETGYLSVTMAGHGTTSFGAEVWADFLGVPQPGKSFGIDDLPTPEEALSFFVANLELAVQKVAVTPDLKEALTDINWVYVKRRLGIDPDEPRPGRR
jgi:hypothetical protein